VSSSVKRAVPLRSVAGTGSWDSGRGRAWGAELPFLSCPARGGVAVKPGGVGGVRVGQRRIPALLTVAERPGEPGRPVARLLRCAG
jgi:hypothetical protein